MFHVLVAADEDAWNRRDFILPKLRFLEFTNVSIAAAFGRGVEKSIEKLLMIPAVFVALESSGARLRVGWLTSIKERGGEIRIKWRFDGRVREIPPGESQHLYWDFEIEKEELSREHWAIKPGELFDILKENNCIIDDVGEGASADKASRPIDPNRPEHSGAGTFHESGIGHTAAEQPSQPAKVAAPASPITATSCKIFIVHGRDSGFKNEVALFVKNAGLDYIILHERPNLGRPIIGKLKEEAADIAFAIVLLTPDDVGGLKGATPQPRARQNVVFELGFFIAALGSHRVAAIMDGEIEKPSDYDGVAYITRDDSGAWKQQLAREWNAVNISFDSKALLR